MRRAREHAARRPEQPVHLVEVVDQQVDGDPARPGRVAHPVVPVRRGRQPQRGHRERPAEATVGEPPLQLDVLGPEAQHEPDHEEAAAPLRRRHDCVGVLERQRDRLLEEDVLAGGEGRLGPLTVQRRRQADVDGVDLRVAERRQEIVGQLGADRGRDRGGAVAPTGGDRLDAHTIAERAVVRGVRGPHEPAAEDRDRDHARGCRKRS